MFNLKTQDLEETVKRPDLYGNQPLNPEFQRGLEQLYHIPIHRSLYQVTRCLWELWRTDPPQADTFWLLAVGPRMEVCGLAVVSERTRSNWSNYHSIDDEISWEQTINFQVTHADIGFGPNGKPSFWGLYRHLQRVCKELLAHRRLRRRPA